MRTTTCADGVRPDLLTPPETLMLEPRRRTGGRPLVTLLAALLLLPFAAMSAAADTVHPTRADGRISAVPGGPVDVRLVREAARSGRLVVTTDDGRHLTRDVGDAADARAALDTLLATPGIAQVEADQLVSTQSILDPLRSEQWELDRIGADVTQAAGVDGEGVVIAVLDTGVQRGHVDLQANVLPGYDAITRTAADSIPDHHGHGTLTAGSAAMAANDVGGRGVAHAASILPVKVLGDDGNGRLSDVVRGIDWAVDQGADVINLSLAGTGTISTMDAALDRAADAGVVVVAATGNLARSGNPVTWPAAHPTTVAVAASRPDDRIAAFSGHGDYVTVAAPGVQVLGTQPSLSSPWTTWSGTSAATPVAAGALAAAIDAAELSMTSRADVEALVGALTSTAEDLGAPGFDPYFGHGLIRVDRLVAAVAPDLDLPADGDETEDPDATPVPGDDVDDQTGDDPPPVIEPAPAPVRFSDVASKNPHRLNIEYIRDGGVTEGCGEDLYCPDASVTRGQMATFLARALGLDLEPYEGRFSDVPRSNGHARAIEALARAEVTGGCGGDSYCPGAAVRRDQMASFLARAYRLPVPTKTQVFSDVTGGAHARNIAAVEAAAITGGCRGDRYCPGVAVRRDQMASFIARAMQR